MRKITLILWMMLSVVSQASAQISVDQAAEAFGTLPEIRNVRISPDGRKLLHLRRTDINKWMLVTQSLDDPQSPQIGIPATDGYMSWARWLNNDYIGVNLTYTYRNYFLRYTPITRGYLMKVDWQGKSSSQFENMRSFMDVLEDDPDHILTQGSERVYKLNVNTMEEDRVLLGPIHARNYVLDKNNQIRFGYGTGNSMWANHIIKSGYYRKTTESEWEKIYDYDQRVGTGVLRKEFFNKMVTFMGYTDDPNIIYVLGADENNIRALYTYNIDLEQKLSKIVGHEKYDITKVEFDENYNLEAYYYNGDYPVRVPISDRMQRLDRMFKQNFPDAYVDIENTSLNENKLVLRVTAPTEPGSYYVLDLENKSMKMVGYIYRNLNVDELATMSPITLNSRDGTEMPGYISYPKGREGEKLPTVLLVNNEAMGRANWEFNAWTQFLTSRGYAVVRVNPRGSSGYGNDYQFKGFFELGDGIIDDINDGAQSLMDKGIVDVDKLCILGQNYGGYVALQSNIVNKDLFKCVIVYDAILDFKIYVDRRKTNYVEQRGMDAESMSPYHRRAEFQKPLLYMIGSSGGEGYDERVARFMSSSKDAGLETSYVKFEDQEKNNRAGILKEMDNFLARHLKE